MSSTLMSLSRDKAAQESRWSSEMADKSYKAEVPASGEQAPSSLREPVAQHLRAHGVEPSEATEIAAKIAPELEQQVGQHREMQGSEPHLMFYPKGEIAVAIEPAAEQQAHSVQTHGALAISMDTLKHVQEHGMPYDGIAAVTKELGSEVRGMSGLDVVDKFGADVVHAIGREGYPAEPVAEARDAAIKQLEQAGVRGPVVSQSQSLELLGELARNESPQVTVMDERTGKAATVAIERLREDAGFDYEPVKQRDSGLPSPGQELQQGGRER